METHERGEVRRALDSLKLFLGAYLAQRGVKVERTASGFSTKGRAHDIQGLLRACLTHWDSVLRSELPSVARSYIHELIDIRNRWAHEEPFSRSEADRATDTARQLAKLLGAPGVVTPLSASITTSTLPRKQTQRETMSRLYAANGCSREAAIEAYAAAERRGELRRRSNKHGLTAVEYARALFADGEKKGWLTAHSGYTLSHKEGRDEHF